MSINNFAFYICSQHLYIPQWSAYNKKIYKKLQQKKYLTQVFYIVESDRLVDAFLLMKFKHMSEISSLLFNCIGKKKEMQYFWEIYSLSLIEFSNFHNLNVPFLFKCLTDLKGMQGIKSIYVQWKQQQRCQMDLLLFFNIYYLLVTF